MSPRKPTPVTGNVALRALLEWQDGGLGPHAREAAERLMRESGGNLAVAAGKLGLEYSTGQRHMRALIQTLDMEEWMIMTWPERRKGGPAMWRK